MNDVLSLNHFELFNLPAQFEVNLEEISKRYRELQRSVHPDRFANASDRERLLSVQRTAQINEAYQVLRSPIERARYLLQLQGVEFEDEKDTTFEPEFLMEQMELREAIAEVRSQHDPLTSLSTTMRQIKSKTQAMIDDLTEALQRNDRDQAKQMVHRLQFMKKLQHECEQIEEELVNEL